MWVTNVFTEQLVCYLGVGMQVWVSQLHPNVLNCQNISSDHFLNFYMRVKVLASSSPRGVPGYCRALGAPCKRKKKKSIWALGIWTQVFKLWGSALSTEPSPLPSLCSPFSFFQIDFIVFKYVCVSIRVRTHECNPQMGASDPLEPQGYWKVTLGPL